MRSLKVNAFAWLAGVAIGAPLYAADPFTAELYSHQALDGHSYYAVSVRGPVQPTSVAPHDHLILVDTSASQVGEHRTMAINVLKELLSSLPETDRVQIHAIDLKSTVVTKGYVSPGEAARQALPVLQSRLPAGATDLLAALNTAAGSLQSGNDSSIVYIGDGMSSAHLLQQKELQTVVTDFRDRHIPIHGFMVGANKDLQLLGILAQTTGGFALIDDPSQTAAQVGKTLATAIDRPVIYPTSLTVKWGGAEVLPQQALPLRSDRETIYLARGQWQSGASLGVQTSDGELMWSVPNAKYQQGNQNLAGVWQQAETTAGLAVPFAGVDFLNASRQSFADEVARLEFTADRLVAKGDIAKAEAVTQQLRQLDPANTHANVVKNRVGKLMIQTVAQVDDKPAADAAGEAPAAPDAPAQETPASEELKGRDKPVDLSPIAQEEARRKARTQKLRQQLTTDIEQAKRALNTAPDAAVSLVESSRGAIKSAMDIDADEKAQLLKTADAALTDIRNRIEVIQGRIQATEQRKAEQEAQQRVIDFTSEQDEKLRQIVDRIRALMDDGYHGDGNAFEEAEAVSRLIETLAPNSALATATVFTSEAAGQLQKAEALRSLRYDRFLEALASVEQSHVPFSDEPPVRYPSAAVWQQITLKREKWKSVDLHKDSPNEQKILKALDQQTNLEFPDNTLKEVFDYIHEIHNKIPIHLDKEALTDAGVDEETRVNLVVNGITLRSALKLLSDRVQGGLAYVIEDEVMKVTTKEKADEKYQTRVYPVGDLVIPIPVIQITQGNAGGGGLGGGQGGQGGGQGGFGGGGGGQGGFGGGGGGGFMSVPTGAIPVEGKKKPLN